MPQALIVVPCFHEERRLDPDRFEQAVDSTALRFLFVDDGSRDGTRRILEQMAARRPGAIDVLALSRNGGKAEAVRTGLRQAIDGGATVVGYTDADSSTPLAELDRLAAECEQRGADVVLGARVALLGRDIERTWSRHLLGRLFATMASLILEIPVYDTQCGAKILRVTPALRDSLEAPFLSRWAFDVELIGRLLVPRPGVPPTPLAAFVEVPLRRWHHVGGGSLDAPAMAKVLFDLWRIRRDLRFRRAALG